MYGINGFDADMHTEAVHVRDWCSRDGSSWWVGRGREAGAAVARAHFWVALCVTAGMNSDRVHVSELRRGAFLLDLILAGRTCRAMGSNNFTVQPKNACRG